MEEQIVKIMEIINGCGYDLPGLGFSNGTSSAEISMLENVTGQTLSDDFKLFLSYINGQANDSIFFLPDQTSLFSVEEIIGAWKAEQECAYETEEFYNNFEQDDKIRCTVFHKSRIAFGGQDGLGTIYIDNDPGPNGKVGQVIYLVTECSFVLLADSFSELLKIYIDGIEGGLLKLKKELEGLPNALRLLPNTNEASGYAFAESFHSIKSTKR